MSIFDNFTLSQSINNSTVFNNGSFGPNIATTRNLNYTVDVSSISGGQWNSSTTDSTGIANIRYNYPIGQNVFNNQVTLSPNIIGSGSGTIALEVFDGTISAQVNQPVAATNTWLLNNTFFPGVTLNAVLRLTLTANL